MSDAKELTRTELRRVANEFQSERDAAKRDAMRAFDERNVLLDQLTAERERSARLEADARRWQLVRAPAKDARIWVAGHGEQNGIPIVRLFRADEADVAADAALTPTAKEQT